MIYIEQSSNLEYSLSTLHIGFGCRYRMDLTLNAIQRKCLEAVLSELYSLYDDFADRRLRSDLYYGVVLRCQWNDEVCCCVNLRMYIEHSRIFPLHESVCRLGIGKSRQSNISMYVLVLSCNGRVT